MGDPFVERVRETVRRHRVWPRRVKVLVAVSGGPDSIALLAALVDLGVPLCAAHVNHRLRGRESMADEAFVRKIATRLGVELEVVDGRMDPGANLEERARERRYTLLLAAARRLGASRVATGHTRDDQAETVLLRLLRGSGSAGLAAIAPLRSDGVARPLLDCSRSEVRAFLRRRGLPFRTDRSNSSLRFTRNRIRNRLLPLLEREFNPEVRAALARLADLAREDEAWLERRAGVAARRIRRGSFLDARRLSRLPAAVARRVVRRWLAERRGHLKGIEAGHVDTVLAVARGELRAASIRGGEVRSAAGLLRWSTPAPGPAVSFRARLTEDTPLEVGSWRLSMRRARRGRIRPGPWRAVFDTRGLDGGALEVRTAVRGARIRPLGLRGTKKLQDVFVDAKIPRNKRAEWPLLVCGETVLWAPGLVRSEHAPVCGATGEVIVVEAVRDAEKPDVAAKNTVCYGLSRRPQGPRTRRGRSPRTLAKEPF